jgi:hypothetical protein
MIGCRVVLLGIALLAVNGAAAAPPSPDKGKEAARIERQCGLKKGTLTVHGGSVWLNPTRDEAYEHIDCALGQLRTAGLGKLGFVGNEADPNAVLATPLRYIAVGPCAQIAALTSAARTELWTIDRTATASDGTAIVQFESGAAMTNGQADRLLQRIWKNEFGDILFGFAPRKLSSRDPLDD